MAATKIVKFIGAAPKLASEHLPDVTRSGVSGAQVAFNTKVASGDIIPYHRPRLADNVGRTGPIGTIYALRCQDTDELKWLSFENDVDIVIATESETAGICNRQRFYYTGDGPPKVSYGDIALAGPGPYPAGFYRLGLPLPEEEIDPDAISFDTKNTVSFARDSGNTATIVTSAPHGLRTGNIISVRSFDGDTPETFNATNVEATVIDDTTLTYFNPGDQVNTTNNSDGRVELAGRTIPRSYVFTWFTPWGEESIPSLPSEDVFVKEGQTVIVKDLPEAPPTDPDPNFIRGIRLYRSLASPSGTEYFRLATLWFPTSLETVAREDNVATIRLQEPHNLIEGDRFKISGSLDSSFDITDGEVLEVIDRFTFTFEQTAADVAEKGELDGILYHDVSENLDDPARYWGDGGDFEFTDDFNARNLTRILSSDTYEAPPEDLQGLTAIQNNILAGFVGNKVYFSEPGEPHAWPSDAALVFEFDIVGLAPVSGDLVVLTKGNPYRVSGNNPQTMTRNKVDAFYPCLAKKSIVNMGFGAVYATHGGLAVYNPVAGADLITKFVHDWDTWAELLDPSKIIGQFYDGKYFGSYSDGNSFIFERDDQIGGFFVRVNRNFTAAWNDPVTNILYFVQDETGDVYEWDSTEEILTTVEWKSKTFVVPSMINVGAARVIADFAVPEEELQAIREFNENVPVFNQSVWDQRDELGTLNSSMFGFGLINGDPHTRYILPEPATFVVTFRLWADKKLVFSREVINDRIFRLPLGYKTDTYEVGVSGRARVRAIHFGETPYGLREV